MANLLASLMNSASTLNAYDQVLRITQNNVANASTPGYARQSQTLVALSFDPSTGDAGGVGLGAVISSRDEYAEEAVRQQNALLGEASQSVNSLTALQTNFDISGDSGIPYALNNLLQAFSAWGQTPNDVDARQNVINQATDLASAFQDAATGLNTVTQNTNQQLQQTVTQINTLVSQLQQYNKTIMQGDHNDAGLDAQVHATLEQLSQYVNFTATQQSDGTVTVLLNGQTPLLMEDRQYPIGFNLTQAPDATNANAPPLAEITGSDGTDLTGDVTGGQLGALINVRNSILPAYIGDGSQQGYLNTMAQQFADRVNQLLTSGNISDGPPAQGGVALFTYDSANPTNVAGTLAVNPAISAAQLAAIDPGPPEVANGVALALSGLANPTDSPDQIDGESFTEFYASMASRVGNALSAATNQQQVQQSAVAQAQNLRQQSSGVDLDEEAMTLVQFQRAYEANSKLITILDQLTEDVINILST